MNGVLKMTGFGIMGNVNEELKSKRELLKERIYSGRRTAFGVFCEFERNENSRRGFDFAQHCARGGEWA